MVRQFKRQRIAAGVALAMSLALGLSACGGGDNEANNPTLTISLFGWGPDATGQETFIPGMPFYETATEVRLTAVVPGEGRVLGTKSARLLDGRVALPAISYGAGRRVDVGVYDGNGQLIASGATPVFDLVEGGPSLNLRVMVAPINRFSPVGSLVSDRTTGERRYVQSRLDYRAFAGDSAVWLGRVGHAALPTSDGKVLIVGGADVTPGSAPGSIPQFRRVHQDVQIFDPETGYFTDLAYDDATGLPRQNGADALGDPRAFHTVTPLGDDKFLVVGGYTKVAETTRAVSTIELIDLKAAPGRRVVALTDLNGLPLTLNKPRGFHNAQYLASVQKVLILGGIGNASTDIHDTVELIDVAQPTMPSVLGQTFTMSTPRTDACAVTLGDGSVWIAGGRNNDGVVGTSERLVLSDSGVTSVPEAALTTPRYEMGCVLLDEPQRNKILLVGGFTSLDGTATGNFELGIQGRAQFISSAAQAWSLARGRGAPRLVLLPQSNDVLVFGGRGTDGQTVASAERLTWLGLDGAQPFQASGQDMGSFRVSRYRPSITRMTSGQILVFGGEGVVESTLVALDNAELYNPFDPVGGAAPSTTPTGAGEVMNTGEMSLSAP